MSESENPKEGDGIGREGDRDEGNEEEELVGVEENPQRLQRNVPTLTLSLTDRFE